MLEPGKSMTIYVVCNPDSTGAFHDQAIVHTTAMNPYLNIHLFGFGAPTGGGRLSVMVRWRVFGIKRIPPILFAEI